MSIIAYFTLFGVIGTGAMMGLLLAKGLKATFERKMFIFNLALFVWQIEDFLLRVPVSKDLISEIDSYLSFSYIFIGYFLVDVIFEARLIKIKNIYWVRSLIFLISTFFFVSYISFPEPRLFLESDVFGLVLGFREGSMDILARVWVGTCILLSLCILTSALFNDNLSFKYLKLFFIGLLIPSIYGLVFQVYFPLAFGYEVPGTTILVFIFSIVSLVIFKNNFVFLNFRDEAIHSVFDKVNTIIFVFDDNGYVYYGNNYYRKYFSDYDSIYNFSQGNNFLSSVSQFMGEGIPNRTVDDISEVYTSEERIGGEYFQYTCCPIFHNEEIKGGIVFGLNMTKFAHIKSTIINSFENFKRLNQVPNSYFLEIDLGHGQILFNDRFLQKFLMFKEERYSYAQLLLSLRNFLDETSLKGLISDLRGDSGAVFGDNSRKTLLKLNSEAIFYVFEVSFKKFDHQVTSNNHMVYITDVTDNYIESLNHEWVAKSIPWVVSHIFRKPVANILGLLNLIKNEKEVLDSRLSVFDVYSLIHEEIKDLDNKIEIFADRNTNR
ncbi:hypothetical protein LZF95_01145 [Algoriphagus sp. AGSA1]|uniref:hypothetical protein n=1 Tax=Algoriphagus sp. AGSA1 TaxID=2907213 RepID=UPI001F359D98|nr:hypothetical protein [Algoriphagus sp. AGSA1]MCE7053261.1 hypothetical protein [Algoriphagus sp. AGSA1]